jgi:hypothetical protein
MRRVQFIEIHDQPWFPSFLRHDVTDTLQFGFNLFRVYAPIAPLLQVALDSTGSRSIVDLCSGGGGPWLDLSRRLQREELRDGQSLIHILLTDKYPNPRVLQNVRAASGNGVTVYEGSVDALKVPGELKGFRMMFTSFHHFPPEQAGAILQNAVDAGEGIGIFEITRRASSTVGLMLAWVLMLSVCTPWIRPFRWSRLIFTYFVPLIPFVLLFDGVVSCLRTYRPQELREMVERLRAGGYEWKIGEHSPGRAPITYLIGCPTRRS